MPYPRKFMSSGNKIIYLDQNLVCGHERLARMIPRSTQKWLAGRNALMLLIPSWNVRFGKSFLPFQDIAADYLDAGSRSMTLVNTDSFAQITDERCHQLRRTIGQHHWSVCWSGGVDSTVILVSLLKNLSPAERERVTVYCNLASVAENPRFYTEHISPNFRVVDINLLPSLDGTDHYIINGELGDQLSHGVTFSLGHNLAGLANQSWRTHGKQLIDWIGARSDRAWAEELYDGMAANIDSVAVPVETVQDWTWWLAFNFAWITVKLEMSRVLDMTLELAKDRMVAWYDYPAYQQWSCSNLHTGLKGDLTWPQYKPEFKKYIWEYTHDQYHQLYKIKINSVSVVKQSRMWFCVLDDYTQLYLDRDLDRIAELLPDYIR